MQISAKIGLLLIILSVTMIYSVYERRTYNELANAPQSLILKSLPDFTVESVYDKKVIDTANLTPQSESGLLFVHLWGTWCAPCEAEFPEFINFAKKFENKDVKFLIVAVKDDLKKVKKFLKQFKDLPNNIVLAFDETGKIQGDLGTAKVPETFLFNSKREHIRKFVGSQKWETKFFLDYVKNLVNNKK